MNKIIFTDEEEKDIINLYQNWTSAEKIGEKFNVCEHVIYRILRKNDIQIRKKSDRKSREGYKTNKKYYCNERYFKNIDTEEKAYWLGFMFADGNVSFRKNKTTGKTKGAVVEISLQAEDDYQLYNFRESLNSNHLIKYRDIKLKDKIHKACRFLVYSITMAEDLVSHGCVPNKSLILEPPIGVPDELIRHFIRGYFDGDGHFGFYENNKTCQINVDFSGNLIFLSWIKEMLLQNNITSSQIKKDKRNNVCRLQLFGRNNFMNFYNYIYNDATYNLDRKRDKFRDTMLKFNKEINIGQLALHALKLEID